MTYYVIDLCVRKGSMLQCCGIISPAPVFASVMAMHALDREVSKKTAIPLGVMGVGIIHRSYRPWIEYIQEAGGSMRRRLVQRRGACRFGDGDMASTGKGPLDNAMQPDALCDYDLTLIVKCKNRFPEELLREQLALMRLAGGEIQRCYVRSYEGIDDAVRMIGKGFYIDDVTDMIADSEDSVRDLLMLAQSWVVPATLGYALLERPCPKTGARDGARHAFTEHMIGLVRYTPLREACEKGLRLWRWGWIEDQFVVTNRDVHLSEAMGVKEWL